jgi:hypothetical protein
MTRFSFGLTLAGLLAMSGSALADNFYFPSNGGGNVTWNGVYVNPYSANDTTTGQNAITIFCDDWNTDFTPPAAWGGTVYALTEANVPSLKYGKVTPNDVFDVTDSNNTLSYSNPASVNAYQRYLEVAWLDNLYQTLLAHGPVDPTTQIEIDAAQWTLFVDPSHVAGLIGAINSSGYADAVDSYLTQAQAALLSNAPGGPWTAPGWDVIVPTSGPAMQEFLVQGFSGDTSPVPEPTGVVLLATVAGLIGFVKLRSKRA